MPFFLGSRLLFLLLFFISSLVYEVQTCVGVDVDFIRHMFFSLAREDQQKLSWLSSTHDAFSIHGDLICL